jgi:hypothetical protein
MNDHIDDHDRELIADFTRQARALIPHQSDLHRIDAERFSRGGLSLSDIEDYFFNTSEYLGGMAAVIGATIDAGLDAADALGLDAAGEGAA